MNLFNNKSQHDITRVVESITQAPIKATLSGVEIEVPRPTVRTALLVEGLLSEVARDTARDDTELSFVDMLQSLQSADKLTEVATLYLTGGTPDKSLSDSIKAHCTPTEVANFVMEVLATEGEVESFRLYHFPKPPTKQVGPHEGSGDSFWAIIANLSSYYHLTPNYILDEMTMEDLLMYARVVPSFETDDEEGGTARGTAIEAHSMGEFIKMIKAQE